MDSGATSLSVVLFTLGAPSSGFEEMSRMAHGHRCSWETTTMQDSLRFPPNTRTTSATGRRLMKPYCTRYLIYLGMNSVILGVHADTCYPREIDFSRACCNQAGTTCTRLPPLTYSSKRFAAGCCNTSGSSPRVLHC